MGLTQLISPFYRQLNPTTFRSQFESGQIAWVPTPFAADIPQIMEVQRESPDDHFASKFQIRNMKETDYRKKQKLPIKLLIYSVEKDDRDTGFPAVMVARIKALMYPQFFFCPKHGVDVRNNSIARL